MIKVKVRGIKNPSKPLVDRIRDTEIKVNVDHIDYYCEGEYDNMLVFLHGDILIIEKDEFKKLKI